MRIVMDPSVTLDDAETVPFKLKWQFGDYVKKKKDVPYEVIYRTPEKTEVHLVDDHVIGERYWTLSGPGITKMAAKLRDQVKTISVDDIPSYVDATKAEKVKHGIAFAALLAPEKFDKRFFAWFERGFSHRNPDVREQAIVGSGYVGWKELREKLEEVAENDSDAEIRKSAKLMLEGFELQDRGELEE
ncbi:MAG TPA: hypothetical protein VF618_07140 [Thermoanaerobaculia bacterium]